MLPYNNQMRYTSLNISSRRKHTRKKDGKKVYSKNCNSILTFDIEVTSAWLENGKVIQYRKGMSNEYWNGLEPLSLPYIWQFSCDGVVYYGRELRDFEEVLKDLPTDVNIIIWVHNLSYEFHFLSNFLEWDDVFARSPHKPIKATPKKYKNIEFRCTYMLTRLSLDAWGKQLGVHKATGYLDYEKIRTPLTPLTEDEMYYSEQDCLVVEAGIKEYIKKYHRQSDIPLTQTGTVRKVVKDKLLSNREYSKFIKKLVPKASDEYRRLQNIFAGGYTHANRIHSGVVQRGLIEHYDFASSYPTVMISEKYPMTKWIYTATHELPSDDMFEDYAYIMLLKFRRINSTSYNTYIQRSKAIVLKGKFDNGRVLEAEELELWCTEQDFITIRNNYEWDSIEVEKLYRSKKDYLPKELIEYTLELYENKTTLKDVAGMEDIYLQSKQYINSLFGMMVTAIIQSEIVFNNDEWRTEILTKEDVNNKLKELSDYKKHDSKYFLNYSWGCWVTAYARRNLWKCIEYCDRDVIYCDTDSIFVKGHYDFTWYNNEITNKLKKTCDELNIDFNRTRPKTPKGKSKPLGVFDKEDDCSEFITLGAKRYVERRTSDNKLHLTVSGINKEAVELLNDNIENFRDGFNFDKDADCVHKKLATYIINSPIVQYPDGYISTYTKGINLRRTGYLLSMTDEYKELIKYLDYTIDDLPEQFMIHLRGRWNE